MIIIYNHHLRISEGLFCKLKKEIVINGIKWQWRNTANKNAFLPVFSNFLIRFADSVYDRALTSILAMSTVSFLNIWIHVFVFILSSKLSRDKKVEKGSRKERQQKG